MMSQARRVEGDNLFFKTIHARADQFYREVGVDFDCGGSQT